MNDLQLSLNQGKQFKQLQNKIKKNIHNEIIEGFQSSFENDIKSYEQQQHKVMGVINDYNKRINQSSNFNNNLNLANGQLGYVTGKGKFKWYDTSETFNQTAGKNGCPTNIINSPISSNDYNTPGANIDNLIVGTAMLTGQSCGNEGKNVWVTNVVSNPSSSFTGCYKNDGTSPLSDSTYYTLDECSQMAQDKGYKYYGLQNYQSSSGKALCLVSNDIDQLKSGGQSIKTTYTSLWSSGTTGANNYAELLPNGSLVVKNESNTVLYSTTSMASCNDIYSFSTKTDAYGNDMAYFSGEKVNPDFCKQKCSENTSCTGFAFRNKECWIKNNVQKTKRHKNVDLYRRVLSKSDREKCIFMLSLKDNGNIVINQKNNPNMIWNSKTSTLQKIDNPDWVATKGKYGVNYLESGQRLGPNEWIGSNNGAIKLIMQSDGNLVLYTSNSVPGCTNINGKIYGLKDENAIYELSEVGNPSSLGKLGYIDSDANLREYPESMITKSNKYTKLTNFDSIGNNLPNMPISNSNIESCKVSCNNNDECSGFFFDEKLNQCWIKNNNMYPKSERVRNSNGSLFLRNPKINNGTDCSKEIIGISSNQYDNYHKIDNMTSDTKCDYTLQIGNDVKKMNNIDKKLNNQASKIENNINELKKTYNSDIINIKQTNKLFTQNYNKYMDIKDTKVENYTNIGNKSYNAPLNQNLTINDANGLYHNSSLSVTHENYGYLFWSALAAGIAVVTVKNM